jgi:uncharacterized protein (DUF111 family)
VLRVQLGRELAAAGANAVADLVECNLDDMTGEELGFLVGRLREAGALEAWTAPVQMKKDRPGAVVSALCRPERRADLEAVFFAHSTTLGVRWTRCERTECARETTEIDFRGNVLRVQRRLRPGAEREPLELRDLAIEYDDLAALARSLGVSLREAERMALDAALAKLRR